MASATTAFLSSVSFLSQDCPMPDIESLFPSLSSSSSGSKRLRQSARIVNRMQKKPGDRLNPLRIETPLFRASNSGDTYALLMAFQTSNWGSGSGEQMPLIRFDTMASRR